MSLEADFSPEPPDMSPGHPYLDLSLVGSGAEDPAESTGTSDLPNY